MEQKIKGVKFEFVEINAFFDASFNLEGKKGIAAIYIKDIQSNIVLAKSAKFVKCENPSMAEFKALLRLVNYINGKQMNEVFPKNLVINIYGDNLGVIKYAITLKKIRGINAKEAIEFTEAYEILKSNNTVIPMWVSRKTNSAHKVITKKKYVIKGILRKRIL